MVVVVVFALEMSSTCLCLLVNKPKLDPRLVVDRGLAGTHKLLVG